MELFIILADLTAYMRILPCGLIVLSLFLFSCQQEIEDITTNPPGGGGGGGGSTSGNYQPLTNGSWWKFKDSASGALSTTTATNSTQSFNSILYTALTSTNGTQTSTAYMAAPSPNYYMRIMGISPTSGAPFDITFHYLNDTASVAYNWTYNAGQGNGFTALVKTTILEKNITMSIEGKTYTNVTRTRLDLSYDIMGTIMDFGYYEFFASKGVGLVKTRAELGSFGMGIKTCSNLVDHQIQ